MNAVTYRQLQLRQGWTETSIHRFLGRPDTTLTYMGRSREYDPTYGWETYPEEVTKRAYSMERIEAAEASAEWQAWKRRHWDGRKENRDRIDYIVEIPREMHLIRKWAKRHHNARWRADLTAWSVASAEAKAAIEDRIARERVGIDAKAQRIAVEHDIDLDLMASMLGGDR